MKTFLSYVIIIIIFGSCVSKYNKFDQIIIDKAVQKNVENKISKTDQEYPKNCELRYTNKLYYEFYSNDSLWKHNIDAMPFYSYWGVKDDTIKIVGFYGSSTQNRFGFTIHINDKIPKVNFSYRPHIMGQFSFTKNGEVEFGIDVPTKQSKVTLSQMPDNKYPSVVYGLVEFETNEFYIVTKYENGKEVPDQRDRAKCKMKVYFKTSMCDSIH